MLVERISAIVPSQLATKMTMQIDRAAGGRRLQTWRRALLAFGPQSAKKLGCALAEFAWPDQSDPDADLIVRHCKQKYLMRLCGYSSKQGLYKQLDLLETLRWMDGREKGFTTGRGMFREYVLTLPTSLPPDALAALEAPGPGMWKRVLEANTEGSGQLELTRLDEFMPKPDRVNSSYENSGSGELQLTIGSTPVDDRVNSSSPLEEDKSSSIKDFKEGFTSGAPAAKKYKDTATRVRGSGGRQYRPDQSRIVEDMRRQYPNIDVWNPDPTQKGAKN